MLTDKKSGKGDINSRFPMLKSKTTNGYEASLKGWHYYNTRKASQ